MVARMAVIDFMMIDKSFFFGGYAVTTSRVNVIPLAQGLAVTFAFPARNPVAMLNGFAQAKHPNLKSDP